MDYDNHQLADASPQQFAAQNGDTQTAINLLRSEASKIKPSMDAELLEAAALKLEEEVK